MDVLQSPHGQPHPGRPAENLPPLGGHSVHQRRGGAEQAEDDHRRPVEEGDRPHHRVGEGGAQEVKWPPHPPHPTDFSTPAPPSGSGFRLATAGGDYNRRMPIDIDIAHVARLARLSLTEKELENYGRQCADILQHAARVSAVDASGAEPTAHPMALSNVLREDETAPERILDRETVLSQAPAVEDGLFRVPPALEEG